jgi:hypothetical protein
VYFYAKLPIDARFFGQVGNWEARFFLFVQVQDKDTSDDSNRVSAKVPCQWRFQAGLQ